MKNPTCLEKQKLAFKIDFPRIPIDGTTLEHEVTRTVRNWYHPEMYFIAVMDCHEEIQKTLGTNPFGRIVVNADLKDDDSEFSYENQGALETDVFLFLVYVAFFVLFCRDRLKFDEKFENIHCPHWYCIIGMGL